MSFSVAILPSLTLSVFCGGLYSALLLAVVNTGPFLALPEEWIRRKAVHLLVFATAAIIQAILGWTYVLAWGSGAAGILIATWLLRPKLLLSMHRSGKGREFLAPMAATALGGLTANLLTGNFAIVGYLIAGFGDAAAEGIGRRFGKRRWDRILPRSLCHERSLEGTAAFFAIAIVATPLGMQLAGGAPMLQLGPRFWIISSFVVATVAALTEAVCPPEWDNGLLQLVPAVVAERLTSILT